MGLNCLYFSTFRRDSGELSGAEQCSNLKMSFRIAAEAAVRNLLVARSCYAGSSLGR